VNEAMDRSRAEGRCNICKQFPKEKEAGQLVCDCGAVWQLRRSVRGTPEEETLLVSNGFHFAQGPHGETWYVLQEAGHIIHLYADGTWDSDKAVAESSLERYLAWIQEKRAAIG